jgi:hypothetical protein
MSIYEPSIKLKNEFTYGSSVCFFTDMDINVRHSMSHVQLNANPKGAFPATFLLPHNKCLSIVVHIKAQCTQFNFTRRQQLVNPN